VAARSYRLRLRSALGTSSPTIAWWLEDPDDIPPPHHPIKESYVTLRAACALHNFVLSEVGAIPVPHVPPGYPIGAHPRALRDCETRMFAAFRDMLHLGGRPLEPAALTLRSRYQLPDGRFGVKGSFWVSRSDYGPRRAGIIVLPDCLIIVLAGSASLRSILLRRNQLQDRNGDRFPLVASLGGCSQGTKKGGRWSVYRITNREIKSTLTAGLSPDLISPTRQGRKPAPRPSRNILLKKFLDCS